MASPTTDFYGAASGQSVVGGRSHWVPDPGQLKSVHLNSLSSLNPCPTATCWYSESHKQNGPWANWNGAVFAPEYSQYGAMVFWGGGHGGYSGTEYYIFDLSTRQWSRIGEQIPEGFTVSDWYDYQVNGSYVVPALHTYCHPIYISPSQGGGVKGSWLMGYNVGGPGSNIQPHAVDLATGVSTRFTSNKQEIYLANGPYGGAFVDTNRNVAWLLPGHNSDQNAKINLASTPKTVELVSSFWNPGYYFNPVFVQAKDVMIAAWLDGSTIMINGYSLATGTPVAFTVTQGSTRTKNTATNGLGFDYCQHTGKFYAYEGYGDTTIHVLTPPDNWTSGTWTWATETMGGEAPIDLLEVGGSSGQQPFSKWKYNPSLKCFMWSQGTVSRQCTDGVARDGAFQLYKPVGV